MQKRRGISSKRLLRQRGISYLCTAAVIYARLAREKMSRDKNCGISLCDLLRQAVEYSRLQTPRASGTPSGMHVPPEETELRTSLNYDFFTRSSVFEYSQTNLSTYI